MDDYQRVADDLEGGDHYGHYGQPNDLPYIDEQDFKPPAAAHHNMMQGTPSKQDTDDNYLHFDAAKDIVHVADNNIGTSFHSNLGGTMNQRPQLRSHAPAPNQQLDDHAMAFLAEL